MSFPHSVDGTGLRLWKVLASEAGADGLAVLPTRSLAVRLEVSEPAVRRRLADLVEAGLIAPAENRRWRISVPPPSSDAPHPRRGGGGVVGKSAPEGERGGSARRFLSGEQRTDYLARARVILATLDCGESLLVFPEAGSGSCADCGRVEFRRSYRGLSLCVTCLGSRRRVARSVAVFDGGTLVGDLARRAHGAAA